MTFRDDVRQLAHCIRAIPGDLGMRPYSVEVQTRSWSGARPGEGTETVVTSQITEANGRPPRVRFGSEEEIALGGYEQVVAEIGPITPDFPGGGTLLSAVKLEGTSSTTLVNVRLTGPDFPNGANFRVREVRSDMTFHYRIFVERSADN